MDTHWPLGVGEEKRKECEPAGLDRRYLTQRSLCLLLHGSVEHSAVSTLLAAS